MTEAVPKRDSETKGEYMCKCDNCDWTGEPQIQLGDISDLFQRIDPGSIVPSGECPECGSLCYEEVTATATAAPTPGKLKVKVWSYSEDTDGGTDSEVFATEQALKDHLRDIIIKSIQPEEYLELRDDGHYFKDEAAENQHDIDALEYLRDGDVYEAFNEWQEGGYRDSLDTYNWDEMEVEIPLPPMVQALVDAAALARRAFTDAPEDLSFFERTGTCRSDILRELHAALTPFTPTQETV